MSCTWNKYFLSFPLSPAASLLHNAVSDVIQHPELTERRTILVMARFVTMQSSRPLYMFKQVKSLPRPTPDLFDLNLCYLSSHAGVDQHGDELSLSVQ